MAAMVVPAGDCSNAITRACLEVASFFWPISRRATAGREGFTVACAGLDLDAGFFAGLLAGLDIGISIRFIAAFAAPPKPHLGHHAGRAGSQSAKSALVTNATTALLAAESQSFLDNVVADFSAN